MKWLPIVMIINFIGLIAVPWYPESLRQQYWAIHFRGSFYKLPSKEILLLWFHIIINIFLSLYWPYLKAKRRQQRQKMLQSFDHE